MQYEEELALTIAPTDFPQGSITAVHEDILPDVITIPAVKEMGSTTKRGGKVGELVDATSEGVEEELNEKLEARLGASSFKTMTAAGKSRITVQSTSVRRSMTARSSLTSQVSR